MVSDIQYKINYYPDYNEKLLFSVDSAYTV
jgi:hypothetical protein